MSTKKMLISAIIVCLITLFSTAAYADVWSTATVDEAGFSAASSFVYVKMTSTKAIPAWSGSRWYKVSGADAKAILAVALSAQANGVDVNAWLQGTTEWSIIYGLFQTQAP